MKSSTPLHKEIKAIFDADQTDRSSNLFKTDFKKLTTNDRARLTRAIEIYELCKEKKADLSANDLFSLAMIFQHGSDSADYIKTIELATLAGEKGNDKGKWLSAAAEDRYLLSMGKKQKWGTQFKKDAGSEWKLQPMLNDVESGVTDQMRIEKSVPERARQMETFLSKNKKR